MEIKKFKKKKSNLYELLFTDNTILNLYDGTIIKYNLLVNKNIDKKKLLEIIAYNNILEAYYKAIKYLTIKLRTKKEIEKYLLKSNYNKDTINEVIARLEKEKYIKNDIYIKAYINDALNLTSKGPNLIKKELEHLGFKENEYNDYLNIDSNIWHEKINKIITKKEKSNHNYSSKVLVNKIKDYLIKQGYYLNDINACLNNIDFVDNDDILKKEINKEYRKLSKKYENEELRLKIKYNLYRKGFDMSKIEEMLTCFNTD